MTAHHFSVERLVHYSCAQCNHWWSIGDGPTEANTELFCPLCGACSDERQRVVTLSPDCIRFNVAAREMLPALIAEALHYRSLG